VPVKNATRSISTTSAPSLIALALRDDIVFGRIDAGAPLRQDRIAAQFGVSHIPVREALRELVADGLAIFVKNRGVVVSKLSVDLTWELTEYRCLLERQMALWSVPAMTQIDIAEARDIVDSLDRETDVVEIMKKNRSFHNVIFRSADRPFFLKSIEVVRANLARYWRLASAELDFKSQSQRDHRKILTLCRKRNAEAVSDEVERHIRETGSVIISYLKKKDAGTLARS
jgi:DNA-binding GntR family transcriptional regulator